MNAGPPEAQAGKLGERLRRLRQVRGLTQRQLVEKMGGRGVSLAMIRKMEQGRARNPSLFAVAALARALEVSVDELTGGPQARSRATGRGIRFTTDQLTVQMEDAEGTLPARLKGATTLRLVLDGSPSSLQTLFDGAIVELTLDDVTVEIRRREGRKP